jgi:hypothetical protein
MDNCAWELSLALCDKRFDINAQRRLVELESALIVDAAIEVLLDLRSIHCLAGSQSSSCIVDHFAVETCLLMLRRRACSWLHVISSETLVSAAYDPRVAERVFVIVIGDCSVLQFQIIVRVAVHVTTQTAHMTVSLWQIWRVNADLVIIEQNDLKRRHCLLRSKQINSYLQIEDCLKHETVSTA